MVNSYKEIEVSINIPLTTLLAMEPLLPIAACCAILCDVPLDGMPPRIRRYTNDIDVEIAGVIQPKRRMGTSGILREHTAYVHFASSSIHVTACMYTHETHAFIRVSELMSNGITGVTW